MRAGVLVLITLLLSGCTGPNEELVPGGEGDRHNEGGTPGDDTSRTPVAYSYAIPSARHTTLWHNDSFAPTDACNAGGCQSGAYQHLIDLEPHLVSDVPTRLQIELEYEGDVVVIGGLSLSLLAEDATFYRYAAERGAGASSIDATLAHRQGAIAIAVEYYIPRWGDTELPYTVVANVATENETLLPAVPVAVTVEAGQWLHLEPVGAVGSVSVYGTDDTHLAAHPVPETGHDVRLDAPGTYVFVAGPAAPLRISTNGTAPPLEALRLSATFAEPRSPVANGPTEWTFDVEDHPLAVGLYLQSTDLHGAWMHTLDESLRLEGPGGVLAETTYRCTVCLNIEPNAVVFTLGTAPGDPGAGPGTYTGTYDWQGSFGLMVGHYIVHYAR